jgi:hypothetical protein
MGDPATILATSAKIASTILSLTSKKEPDNQEILDALKEIEAKMEAGFARVIQEIQEESYRTTLSETKGGIRVAINFLIHRKQNILQDAIVSSATSQARAGDGISTNSYSIELRARYAQLYVILGALRLFLFSRLRVSPWQRRELIRSEMSNILSERQDAKDVFHSIGASRVGQVKKTTFIDINDHGDGWWLWGFDVEGGSGQDGFNGKRFAEEARLERIELEKAKAWEEYRAFYDSLASSFQNILSTSVEHDE